VACRLSEKMTIQTPDQGPVRFQCEKREDRRSQYDASAAEAAVTLQPGDARQQVGAVFSGCLCVFGLDEKALTHSL
jgi:hypothetical protein